MIFYKYFRTLRKTFSDFEQKLIGMVVKNAFDKSRVTFLEQFSSTKKFKKRFFSEFEPKFFNEAVKTSLYAPEEQLVTETLEKNINKAKFFGL